MLAIEFTGGDPLLHPDGISILEKAEELGFFYTINSDLTRITDEQMDRLALCKNLIAVQTTIDGPDAIINDQYRGAGSFRHIIDGTARLTKRGIPVHAGMIISNSNFGSVREVAQTCAGLGIERLFVGSLYKAGRAIAMSDAIPSNDQLGVASRSYAQAIVDGVVKPVHPTFYMLLEAYSNDKDTFNHLQDGPDIVNVGLYNVRCDPNGLAFTSIKLEGTPLFVVGDLKTSSLMEIWSGSPQLIKLRTLYDQSSPHPCIAPISGKNIYHALNTSAWGGLDAFRSSLSAS